MKTTMMMMMMRRGWRGGGSGGGGAGARRRSLLLSLMLRGSGEPHGGCPRPRMDLLRQRARGWGQHPGHSVPSCDGPGWPSWGGRGGGSTRDTVYLVTRTYHMVVHDGAYTVIPYYLHVIGAYTVVPYYLHVVGAGTIVLSCEGGIYYGTIAPKP